MILTGQTETIVRWVEARLPGYRAFDAPAGFGVLREGRLAAGVIFHNYDARAGDIELVIAADSPRWASREVFFAAFAYPFLQLGCRRVTARVPVANRRARRLVEGAGFTLEGLMRSAAQDGSDVLIYGMLKGECCWVAGHPRLRSGEGRHCAA
ncbi:MAG TPA: GNAT family protein [Alphaproteobacteria bacterium]|nr:GNAT family protein [Alphaproteobacteria bacterium]